MWRGVIGIGTAGLLGGACAPEPTEATREQAREIAAAAANDLVGALMPELQAAMQAEGPTGAIRVCSERAQELTAGVEAAYAEHGLRIRRTALRVRNPVNAPDAWERDWMATAQADATPVVLDARDERGQPEIRYLRPLIMNELCLACHGPPEQIDPAVSAALAERYPDDQATGFKVGELRGMVTVRVGLKVE